MTSDPHAPYTVREDRHEDVATWWGPYATLDEAKEALVQVKENHGDHHIIRDAYGRKVKQ